MSRDTYMGITLYPSKLVSMFQKAMWPLPVVHNCCLLRGLKLTKLLWKALFVSITLNREKNCHWFFCEIFLAQTYRFLFCQSQTDNL